VSVQTNEKIDVIADVVIGGVDVIFDEGRALEVRLHRWEGCGGNESTHSRNMDLLTIPETPAGCSSVAQ